MVMLGGNPSIPMGGLGSIFQYDEYNYMRSDAQEKFVLAYADADYEEPRGQAPMGFMDSGGLFYDGNAFHCEDPK